MSWLRAYIFLLKKFSTLVSFYRSGALCRSQNAEVLTELFGLFKISFAELEDHSRLTGALLNYLEYPYPKRNWSIKSELKQESRMFLIYMVFLQMSLYQSGTIWLTLLTSRWIEQNWTGDILFTISSKIVSRLQVSELWKSIPSLQATASINSSIAMVALEVATEAVLSHAKYKPTCNWHLYMC